MDIWWPEVPVWEVVLRSLVAFIIILGLLRLAGKRDVGEMSPADFILLLLLSANVHTTIAGTDKSILGGLMGASALILANMILNHFAHRSRRFEKLLKGVPEIILYNGVPNEAVLKRHHLTHAQLRMAIRKESAFDFAEVKVAILEIDGSITVFKKDEKPISREDITPKDLAFADFAGMRG